MQNNSTGFHATNSDDVVAPQIPSDCSRNISPVNFYSFFKNFSSGAQWKESATSAECAHIKFHFSPEIYDYVISVGRKAPHYCSLAGTDKT